MVFSKFPSKKLTLWGYILHFLNCLFLMGIRSNYPLPPLMLLMWLPLLSFIFPIDLCHSPVHLYKQHFNKCRILNQGRVKLSRSQHKFVLIRKRKKKQLDEVSVGVTLFISHDSVFSPNRGIIGCSNNRLLEGVSIPSLCSRSDRSS